MKTKVISFAAGVISLLVVYSFTSVPEDDGPLTALVKINLTGSDKGCIITYGDGRADSRTFEWNFLKVESRLESQKKLSAIINELNEKGYYFSGHTPAPIEYLIFEKK